MRAKKVTIGVLVAAVAAIGLTACGNTSAGVASHNLSKDAEHFKIDRRVVFVNGITDKYLLNIEGKCSINDQGNQLEVTCKTGEDEYKKHFLGLSDNVTYFVEQLEGANVSEYHYKVIYRPATIVPDIDLDLGSN